MASTATGVIPTAEREAAYTNLESRFVPVPRHRVQWRCRVDQRRSDGSFRRPAARVGDGLVPGLGSLAVRACRMGYFPPACLSRLPAAQQALRGATGGANADRAGTARHPAAGFHQRVDAASRGDRPAAGRLSGQAIADAGARPDGKSDRGGAQCRARAAVVTQCPSRSRAGLCRDARRVRGGGTCRLPGRHRGPRHGRCIR